jgi:AraC family transcriptional activator of mtrCDE
MIVGNAPAITLTPHMLVITPPGQPFWIDATTDQGVASMAKVVEARWQSGNVFGTVQRFTAGGSEPEVMMICGYFSASYSESIDLFTALPSPIVERFDASDQLDYRLKAALAELVTQQIGAKTMTKTLLKQVLVALFRRSLSSADLWLERFSTLSDPQAARAFAKMVAQPGAPHSLQTLSQTAGLSRSAFMARFASAFGCSPMVALRQLRMRHAAKLLAANRLSVDQVARAVGFASRSSFSRVFRQAHGTDPSDYRKLAQSLIVPLGYPSNCVFKEASGVCCGKCAGESVKALVLPKVRRSASVLHDHAMDDKANLPMDSSQGRSANARHG